MPDRQRFSQPPRLLIASDRNHGLRDLESFLGRNGYAVLRLYAGTPVVERARALRPDIIVLDAELADRASLDLSRTLRDDPLIGASTPILLLVTAQPTAEDHRAALRAGIWEFLAQPLNTSEVLAKLDSYVLAKADADRVPRQERVDEGTGLYTARGLAGRARDLIRQAAQHNTSVACVVFALEPAANAASSGAGAPATELVRRVTQVFKAAGRHSDALGRIGPTEFAVVAPGTNSTGAVKLAERLRRATQPGGAEEVSPARLGFELRAGYAAISNVRYTPTEPKDLLARATRALQMAKAQGEWIHESAPGA
ncbi:MAG TPA: diguanylate cyclase [Gemmatimonadales bacterium]|jgi:diguanylate cyclase (GGDEF)-like protein|nr:diguanylate cyclase [Gemmatimonadales bacterium]